MKSTCAQVVLYCDCYWANEAYLGFGLVAFPSIEALIAHANDCLELKWPQFFSTLTIMGTPRE